MPEKIYTVKRTDETLLAPVLARYVKSNPEQSFCIITYEKAHTDVLTLILDRYNVNAGNIITPQDLKSSNRQYDHILWWLSVMPCGNVDNITVEQLSNKAQQSLVFFIPNTISGEPVLAHSVLDSLETEEYNENEQIFDEVEQIPDRTKKEFWDFAVNNIRPNQLSASQLTTFLSCPLKWLLEKHFRLQTPAEYTQNHDDETTTPGLLVHKVLELLFKEKKDWNAQAAADRACVIFDELTSGSIGPEENCSEKDKKDFAKFPIFGKNESECIKIKQILGPSVKRLVELLQERKLTIQDTEEKFQNLDFEDIRFTGSIDLSLQDQTGQQFILDYKYSSNGKHYIEAARESRSVQLASYVWSKDSDFNQNLQSAYYIVPTKNFFLNPQDNKDVWARVKASYHAR